MKDNGGNTNMNKAEMKTKLQNFIDNLMKDYNDKLECFVRDEDDMINEFRELLENPEDYEND